jgi:hypothetical protein
VPSKYEDPPNVLGEYILAVFVKPNGFNVVGFAFPYAVIANAFVELSMNVGDWQVNNCVFAIAVSGVVLGVNVSVYTPVPLTTRKLEIDPVI